MTKKPIDLEPAERKKPGAREEGVERPEPSTEEGLRRLKEHAKKIREQYSPCAPDEDEPAGRLSGGPEHLDIPEEDQDQKE